MGPPEIARAREMPRVRQALPSRPPSVHRPRDLVGEEGGVQERDLGSAFV